MTDSPDQSEVHQLIADIEGAFGDVGLGDGRSLHQADAIDRYRPDSEIEAARKMDSEQRWQDIPDEKVEKFNMALAFMDAAGFRFHMPRFMVYSLTHREYVGFAIYAPIYSCNFNDAARDRAVARYALLSDNQRRIIVKYLRFAAAHEEFFDAAKAAEALHDYWSQYE
jgi:hypothetical protein